MKLKSLLKCAASLLLMMPAAAADNTLPRPEQPFAGKIGETAKQSTPAFPKEAEAPKGAPNILVILTDDVGFGASSTFGGPVPTPAMDRLANAGLRYTRFHTTALCSPTRAALLTGRNHHSVGTGAIMEMATGYPGYNSLEPKSAGTFAEVLRQNGYATAWYGKNHNVPDWQSSQAGPFDLWPQRLGFDEFYGFFGGDTNQWAPALYHGTTPVEPPQGDKNYHLDKDLADRAIARLRMLHSVAPDKPWMFYYSPGTAHAPHHAPKEWIENFKGKFDQGWDKVREETFARQKAMGVIPADARLTPRPDGMEAWDTLDADHKRVYARMMEVYAAALSHADTQIGRVLDAIDALGELDNTLVIYIQGDNGASAEGTPQGLLNEMAIANGLREEFPQLLAHIDDLGSEKAYNHYPVGWALAMDTPFQWTKQIASHFGGTRNGMVISWPKRIRHKGEIRSQFHHVIDIYPTILEAAGVASPEMLNGVAQKPVEGVAMEYSFDSAAAPSRRRTQYFEMLGNRAIYHDGWVAATTPPVLPWVVTGQMPEIDAYQWELYNVDRDFSQAVDLAGKEPKKLAEMQARFMAEARKYDVLPLDNSKVARFDVRIRPSLTRGRDLFTYYPGQTRITEGSAPDLKNRSFSITAEIEVPATGAEGVIATQGGRFNGWGLYLKGGGPVFDYNLAGIRHFVIKGDKPVPAGKHVLGLDFSYDGGGLGKGATATLTLDGAPVGTGRIDRTYAFRVSLDETFDIGEDTGTPVSEDYAVPFRFTGTLGEVRVRLDGAGPSGTDAQRLQKAQAAARAAE